MMLQIDEQSPWPLARRSSVAGEHLQNFLLGTGQVMAQKGGPWTTPVLFGKTFFGEVPVVLGIDAYAFSNWYVKSAVRCPIFLVTLGNVGNMSCPWVL